jgi:hypothetical protein
MYDEMTIVVGKDTTIGSCSKPFANIDMHDNVIDPEHMDLDFDEVTLKEKMLLFPIQLQPKFPTGKEAVLIVKTIIVRYLSS